MLDPMKYPSLALMAWNRERELDAELERRWALDLELLEASRQADEARAYEERRAELEDDAARWESWLAWREYCHEAGRK